MKKIILTLPLVLITLALLVTFIGLPMLFHQGVHKKAISNNFTATQIKFSDTGFNQKSSLVELGNNASLKVTSFSNLNPLNNYLDVDYINGPKDLKVNFQVYFHLHNLSSINMELKFSDEIFTQNDSHLQLKNLAIFVKSFSIIDIKNMISKQYANVLEGKNINLELGKANYKFSEIEGELEGVNIEVANVIDEENLALSFSTEIENLINDHLGEKLGLKSTQFELGISNFEKNLALQFISKVPLKSFATRSPPSIFELLPYIKAIRYPLEFKLRSSSLNDGVSTHLNLDLGLKTQKFLSVRSYTGNLDYKNTKAPTAAILRELILKTSPKGLARRFSLTEDTPPDKRFMERDTVKSKIHAAIKEELMDKDEELIEAALELGLIKKDGELFAANMTMEEGIVTLEYTKMNLKELMSTPSKILQQIYPEAKEHIFNLLISKGLYPVTGR